MHIMMSTFKDFSLPEMYETIRSSDILPDIDRSIDWESMRPMIMSLFHNNTEKGGRRNFDETVMIKALFLLCLYSIVDENLEKELYDRISFHNFLHYPDKMPDARTLWALRERKSRTGTDNHIWSELWKQLESRMPPCNRPFKFTHFRPMKSIQKRPLNIYHPMHFHAGDGKRAYSGMVATLLSP
jgi:IS5 family transposase